MSEITALEKYPCPACGAQAEWSARKKALVCPFCGTHAPGELQSDGGTIIEHDLVHALREYPDEGRGWQAQKRTVKCQSCQAISVFEPGRVGQNCDFCGSPSLVDYTEIKAPIRPESLLPFSVDREQVRDLVKRWLGGRWFAPNALKKRSLVDTIKGVYLPYWTFDSEVVCPWKAESGTYYYTTESYRTANGQTRQRQVRHTRWSDASGSIEHRFDDVLVKGTSAVNLSLLSKVEPFPTGDLVPYDTAYLSGWTVEHYQIILLDAAREAREMKNRMLQQMCAKEVPGDTHRNLRIDPHYTGQTFKHILLPVWLLNYDYGKSRHQVLINGFTGKVAGNYPKSVLKIALLVLAILIVVGTVLVLSKS